jgi:sulfur-oxidizing protein SoxX
VKVCRAVLAMALAAGGCSTPAPPAMSPPAIVDELERSFEPRNGVTLDRLRQTPGQAFCSAESVTGAAGRRAIEPAAIAAVRFPAGDAWLGDWRRGEALAQSGRGLQYSDPPGAPAGGNCYGCHRLAPGELAYGTLGPSLTGYGVRHPPQPDTLRATWIRLYDAHAINACSVMPRFGAAGILGEDALRDVMALLFDPQSAINR